MSNGQTDHLAKRAVLLAALAPLVAGCSGLSGLTDFSMKDQQWFARTDKLFNQSSIEAAPLSRTRAVTNDDLMSGDGGCPGVSAPANANASVEEGQNPTSALAPSGAVALGHTECDVARALGVAPDNFNISADPRGERMVQATYMHGPRPGAYTFTSGRLSAIERVDVPDQKKPARQAKPKKRTPA